MRTVTRYTKGTFQMVWKCPGCGSDGLGCLDYRHCPNCGHVQEENLRYIPAPGQRIRVPFKAGRRPDVECEYCGAPCPAKDHNCLACGAGLGGAKSVHVRAPIPEEQSETAKDAERDWKARKHARREARKAHHDTQARKARERQRAEDYREQRRQSVARRQMTLSDYAEPDFSPEELSFRRSSFFSDLDPRAVAMVGIAVLLFSFMLTCVFWKKDVQVTVDGHIWTRSVSVERFRQFDDSDWCGSEPHDAYDLSWKSEIHHYDKVFVRRDCHTESGSCSEDCNNEPNGDGTFSVNCVKTCTADREVCEDVYDDEPVYENKCYYTVNRWKHNRYVNSGGRSPSPEPYWPTPEYQVCDGVREHRDTARDTQLGCERLGERKQRYTVQFVSGEDSFKCVYGQRKWASFKRGSVWDARVGVIWTRLDCKSLKEPGNE